MGNFQITVKGLYEKAQEFEKIVISWGIPSGAKKGPRVNIDRDPSNPKLGYAIANQISRKQISNRKHELIKYWEANHDITLWIAVEYQDHLFDFADAPLDKLDEFLENPKRLIFPSLEILPDGCKRCFQNALDLVTSAESLLKQKNILMHHVEFFILTAIEEFGKGLLILKQGKIEMKSGKSTATMSFFRSHREKFDEASRQLAGEQQAGLIGRKKAAWDCLVEHLQASGRPDALSLSDPDILDLLLRMRDKEFFRELFGITGIRHTGETYREQTLYVEYLGRSKSWNNPQTQRSERDLVILGKHLRMYCEVMIREIGTKDRIDKVRDIQEVLTDPDFILPSDC